MNALKADERTLHQAARLAFHSAPASRRLVALVDQFEEVFTICRDDDARDAMAANLLYASSVAGGRVIVLMTMWADFYRQVRRLPRPGRSSVRASGPRRSTHPR
jgi:hypothetical protein